MSAGSAVQCRKQPLLWLQREVSALPGGGELAQRVQEEILAGVAALRGAQAAATLRECGLQRLHEAIDARQVGALRDHLLGRLRQPLLALAVAVGRQFLGWSDDFYVDDYLILRVNFPYALARRADPATENPGQGRLSESVRALAQSRKVIDRWFNPRAYHRGHPPAAWAHGPHRDSWVGHSLTGLNIWWAIADVPAAAGLVRYPEVSEENLPRDPSTLCLRASYPLPKPTGQDLPAGHMLVFDPQVLHGTHLNTTDMTRLVISMRLDAHRPTFDPRCFYGFEFWHRASAIEGGTDEILHIRREENLAPQPEGDAVPVPAGLPECPGGMDPGLGIWSGRLESEGGTPVRHGIVSVEGRRILVARTRFGLRAYATECPHYGRDLADGAVEEDRLYCPACGVAFDLGNGESACPELKLTPLAVWQEDGGLKLGPIP
ncbi:MAG TPA: phytanoyl-CoA dioxygenase family protein [Candidatus Aminicenantes bacterium]|nr:phytanoyl-CoA dioxygenase family protein [Candidatus Aminicenantes bacterium]